MFLIRSEIESRLEEVDKYAKLLIASDPVVQSLYDRLMEDDELCRHSFNVAMISTVIGNAYGFNLNELIDLYTGGILHDVGKLYLDKNVLYKPETFTENDRIFMEAHPNFGYRKLQDTNVSRTVLDIVKLHHEKLNGSGYPDSLRGQSIPIYVQIVTASDIFDAMTANRCYRSAMHKEKAMKLMMNDKGLNQVAVSIIDKFICVNQSMDEKIISIPQSVLVSNKAEDQSEGKKAV